MRLAPRPRHFAVVLAAALVGLPTLSGTANAGGPASAQFACIDAFGITRSVQTSSTTNGQLRIILQFTTYALPNNIATTTLNLAGPGGGVTYQGTVSINGLTGIHIYLNKISGTIAVGQNLHTIISAAAPSASSWSFKIETPIWEVPNLYCVARTDFQQPLPYG
jgi:hypothetical protein